MPSTSDKQRRFMGAELARKRAGKKTQTGMSETQLSDFASKKTVDKPGRSLVDVEFINEANSTRDLKLSGFYYEPGEKGHTAAEKNSEFLASWESREIKNGPDYKCVVYDRGPETEFRVEEINPQHYGRDYESSPYKDLFKTNYKSRELNIRQEADLGYQDCETPGSVSGEYESSKAYGVIGYKKVPVEIPDNRTYERQQKYQRCQNEYDAAQDEDE